MADITNFSKGLLEAYRDAQRADLIWKAPTNEYVKITTEPATFEDTFEGIFTEALDILIARQHKYGPDNIRRLGLYGTFGRLADDKVERLRQSMNGTITKGVATVTPTDFDDESFEDALFDIANYALIMVALRRGVWGRPLRP